MMITNLEKTFGLHGLYTTISALWGLKLKSENIGTAV